MGNGSTKRETTVRMTLSRRLFLQTGAVAGAGIAAFGMPGLACADDEAADALASVAFSDVNEGDWFYENVMFVAALGVMTGYSDGDGNPLGLFGPNDSMVREHLACMLYKRYAPDEAASTASPGVYRQIRNGTPLPDVEDGAYYTPAVNWCYAKGLLVGYDENAGELAGLFGVGHAITRAEFATIVYRAFGEVESAGSYDWFSDAADVEGWASDAIAWCVRQGILEGNDGYLLPNATATRAEIATMMTRYIACVCMYNVGSAPYALGATAISMRFGGDGHARAFVEDISANNILLFDDFADWKIVQFERISDEELYLSIEGGTPLTEVGGSILLDEGSFVNPHAVGNISIWGKEPEPFVEEADVSAGQGYVDGSFVIPVNIDSAVFYDGLPAAAFSLPANQSIEVTAVAYPAANEAILTLSVPGATATEQFAALDAALTEGGIVVAEQATTAVGELTAVARAVHHARLISAEEGFACEGDALEYAIAAPQAELAVTAATLNADGTATLTARVTLEVEDGIGSVDLTKAASLDVAHGLLDGASVVDAGSVAVMDASSFTFTRTITAEQAELALVADGSNGALDEVVTQAHLDAALDALGGLFGGCRVSVESGVFNAWGIAQVTEGLRIHVFTVGADLDVSTAFANSVASARDEASNVAYHERVEAGLKATQEALSAIGEIANGAMNASEHWGSIIVGAGSIFGLAAELAGLSAQERYTIDEVMEQLQGVQSQLTYVSSQVSAVDAKLTQIADRTAYYAADDTFTNTCVAIYGTASLGLPSLVQNALKCNALAPYLKTDLGSVANEDGTMNYDDLSAEAKQALETFAKSSRTFTNDRTHQLFLTLTGYILDQTSRRNICDLYFDYLASYCNWEPETFPARKAFVTYVADAFIYAYAANMAEATVALHEAKASGDAQTQTYQESRIASILETAQQVKAQIVGETEGKKVTRPSMVWKRTQDYSSTQIINCVTGASHNLFTAASFFTTPIWDLRWNKNIDDALLDHTVDPIPTYNLDTSSTLSLGELQAMVSNLSNLSAKGLISFSSLLEEMQAMGKTKDANGNNVYGSVAFDFDAPKKDRTAQVDTDWNGNSKKRLHQIPVDGYQLVASSTTMHKDSEKAGGHHERSWRGYTFNLGTNATNPDTIVYWGRTGRSTSWHIDIKLFNYLGLSNGAQASANRG